jgi:hypothetical protein
MTIRADLVTLVVVALVPVLVFTVFVVLRLNRQEHEALERATTERAHVLIVAVDRELARSLTSLDVLASSRNLDHENVRGFYDDALRLLGSHPDWSTVSLASPSGEHLLNAVQPYGAKLALLPDPASVKWVAQSRRALVGSVRRGPLSGKPQFPVRVPVVRDGAAKYVLTALITTPAIQQVLDEQRLPPEWAGAIVDANGIAVARTRSIQNAVVVRRATVSLTAFSVRHCLPTGSLELTARRREAPAPKNRERRREPSVVTRPAAVPLGARPFVQ